MGRVTFVLTKHNPLIKHVKCVVLCQSVLLANRVKVESS